MAKNDGRIVTPDDAKPLAAKVRVRHYPADPSRFHFSIDGVEIRGIRRYSIMAPPPNEGVPSFVVDLWAREGLDLEFENILPCVRLVKLAERDLGTVCEWGNCQSRAMGIRQVADQRIGRRWVPLCSDHLDPDPNVEPPGWSSRRSGDVEE